MCQGTPCISTLYPVLVPCILHWRFPLAGIPLAEITKLYILQIEELERRDAERACYIDTFRADHLQEVQLSYLN